MAYRIEFADRAKKAFADLPSSVQARIMKSIGRLGPSPRFGRNVKKLRSVEDMYRLRVGDYREVYRVFDDLVLVLVVKVGHRREIYRGG